MAASNNIGDRFATRSNRPSLRRTTANSKQPWSALSARPPKTRKAWPRHPTAFVAPEEYAKEVQRKQQQATMQTLYAKTGGARAAGIAMAGWGAFFMVPCLLGAGILSVSGSFLITLPPLLFAAGGAALLLCGHQKAELVKRFENYRDTIGVREHCMLDELAAGTASSPKAVLKNVKKMSGKGMFKQAALDDSETMLIMTRDAYKQYREAQMEAQHRRHQQDLAQSVAPEIARKEAPDARSPGSPGARRSLHRTHPCEQRRHRRRGNLEENRPDRTRRAHYFRPRGRTAQVIDDLGKLVQIVYTCPPRSSCSTPIATSMRSPSRAPTSPPRSTKSKRPSTRSASPSESYSTPSSAIWHGTSSTDFGAGAVARPGRPGRQPAQKPDKRLAEAAAAAFLTTARTAARTSKEDSMTDTVNNPLANDVPTPTLTLTPVLDNAPTPAAAAQPVVAIEEQPAAANQLDDSMLTAEEKQNGRQLSHSRSTCATPACTAIRRGRPEKDGRLQRNGARQRAHPGPRGSGRFDRGVVTELRELRRHRGEGTVRLLQKGREQGRGAASATTKPRATSTRS